MSQSYTTFKERGGAPLLSNPFIDQNNPIVQKNAIAASRPSRGIRAILHIIRPRMVTDIIKRPFIYKFNEQMTETTQEVIGRMVKHPNSGVSFATFNDQLNQTIMPSANGDLVKTSLFQYHWTFVLIVDDVDTSGERSAVVYPTRTIYAGMFMDEPVIQRNGSEIYNEHAFMTVTHSTQAMINETIGMNGTHSGIYAMSDNLHVSPEMISAVSTENQFNLDPAFLTGTMYDDGGMGGFASTAQSIVNNSQMVTLPTEFGSPIHHRGILLNGIATAIKHNTMHDEQGYGSPFGDVGIDLGAQTLIDSVTAVLGNRVSQLGSVIDTKTPFTLGEIRYKFGNSLSTITSRGPGDLTCGTHLGAAPTRENIFSSILMSAIPPIMASLGLVDLSFVYCNHVPGQLRSFFNERRGAIELKHIATVIQCPTEQIKLIFDHFYHQLDQMVLPLLEIPGMDYTFAFSSSSNGDTFVNFYIHGEGAPQDVYMTNNNLFGGINSTTVGNELAKNSNAQELFRTLDLAVPSRDYPYDGEAPMSSMGYIQPGSSAVPSASSNPFLD